MDYELNDQDRADLVINFFKKYGLWLVLVIILIAVGFGVHAYLQKREAVISQNASDAYEAMLDLAQNGATVAEMNQSAMQLIKAYPGTVYASFANLFLAGMDVQSGKLGDAESILAATLKQNRDNTLAPIITLRLARVFIAENKTAQALALLQNPPKDYAAPYALLSGDAALLAQDPVAAKKDYLDAQKAAAADPALNQLISERLNSFEANS